MINLIKIWDLIKSFLPSKKQVKRDQVQISGNKNITIIKNYNIYNNYFNQEDIKSEYNKNKNK